MKRLAATMCLVALFGMAFPCNSNAQIGLFMEFYGKWRGQNRPAPDFTAYDINGKAVKLSDYRGKTVILDFWFTTCHTCIESFPDLDKIAAKYANQDVVVIASCLPEDQARFEKFVNKRIDTLSHIVWVQDRSVKKSDDGVAMSLYGICGSPTQFIINKEGIVVGVSNSKAQLICALPLAGVKVDEAELEQAQADAKVIEDRVRKMADEENEKEEE
jgi:peroxiredoxin